MVTASTEPSNIDEALKLGVVDYLIKPFEYKRLKKSLENYLYRKELINKEEISQKDIDNVMIGISSSDDILPKGLNKITMDRILSFISSNKFEAMNSIEIADGLGVSQVTVRRYMNYLEKAGFIKRESEYGSLGRPCYRYIKI